MMTAAVVTVGTELVAGLVVDTNAAELGVALTAGGFTVEERTSVPDDLDAIAPLLARLATEHDLVVVTGGLGPTHDDVSREAAARALGLPLERDLDIVENLRPLIARHAEAGASDHVFRQADVLRGAAAILPRIGTAPGQIVPTPRGRLVLLPGPPREMRSMLPDALDALGICTTCAPVLLGTTGLPESDVQLAAQRALGDAPGIGFTVLARPGEVRAVLFDRGAGREALDAAGRRVAEELGDACFTTTGETLAEAVLREARSEGITLATAESCTGGMIAAALTDVAGASDVFLGGVVSYSNEVKQRALDVQGRTLRKHGAVSAETAERMAVGVRELVDADVCISVTGIAGPGGGTADKPVGTVWFGLLSSRTSQQLSRHFPGDRATVRMRATAFALDLVRREILAQRRGVPSLEPLVR